MSLDILLALLTGIGVLIAWTTARMRSAGQAEAAEIEAHAKRAHLRFRQENPELCKVAAMEQQAALYGTRKRYAADLVKARGEQVDLREQHVTSLDNAVTRLQRAAEDLRKATPRLVGAVRQRWRSSISALPAAVRARVRQGSPGSRPKLPLPAMDRPGSRRGGTS